MLVADVSGHGVPAALIASMVKVAASAQAAHAADPGRVLSGINQVFCGQLDQQFITGGYLHVDTGEGRFAYASAGHPPSMLWRAGARCVEELADGGPLLGLFDGAAYVSSTGRIAPGDRILLYTDGVVEATNGAGEFFEGERLKDFLAAHPDLPADTFADMLLRHLQTWSGRRRGFDDDLTLVVVDVI